MKSWKSSSDPSVGTFSAGVNSATIPEFYVWNGSHPYWRSGPWNGQVFIGIPYMNSVYKNGFTVVPDDEGTAYVSFNIGAEFQYYLLNHDGTLTEKSNKGKREWEVSWFTPKTDCDVYAKCGPFGSCNSKDSPICSCLRGFEPTNVEEWDRENFTGGCVRRTPLQCERNGSSNLDKKDGFFEADDDESARVGRLDKKRNMKFVTALVIIGLFILAICTYFAWMWMAKQKGMTKKRWFQLEKRSPSPECSTETSFEDIMNQAKLEEVPLFKFENLVIATENFDKNNKLGHGGFGLVYKAWRLWNEGNGELLIDPRITCQDFRMEILRCIHIGLLCVQEFAIERPNMSTVLSMLSSEIANLPKPKQPAFTLRPVLSERHSSQPCTNDLTVTTIVEGR
ncbi:hypothetical protein RHGRI_037409 [Rhododendron griersonianum]|uniref:S-locus glycoprotein domain-containing protein n=1 Tax=Rhododendron griersonianum TaxID=479676 RepID=A0AAV6HRM3_9ERIC|nr:hypothetical protein RHGRI_037409 [Rhododendron griersonianum]